jgi:hypothetical protein
MNELLLIILVTWLSAKLSVPAGDELSADGEPETSSLESVHIYPIN